jgi:TatA/E family protein of Tat protein translocase
MNFLGMGTLELLLILIFAFLFFGPEKLPEIAAKAGRLYRNLRKATSDLGRSITEEISEEKAMVDDLSSIGKSIKKDLLTEGNQDIESESHALSLSKGPAGQEYDGDTATPSYLPYPASNTELTSDTAETVPAPESDNRPND